MSVCDLIAHRSEYDQRMVVVRGAVQGGDGAWLVASPDCDYKLITKGVTWRNIIFLTYPDNRSKVQADHADFPIDWQAIRRTEQQASRDGFDPKREHHVVTYIGLFITYRDLDNRVSPGVPGALKLGFGPLGEAPGQLLIKSLRDVAVVPGPVPAKSGQPPLF